MTASGSVLRLPEHVLFGSGALEATGRIVSGLGRHALICTDQTIAGTASLALVRESLSEAGVEHTLFADAQPDVPVSVVEDCAALAARVDADILIGIGGGSCLDLAKAAAVLLAHGGPLEGYYDERGVPGPVTPIVALPTTAGTGSEVSPVAVVNDPRRRLKVGLASHHLVPRAAIVDPLATLPCPGSVTAHAGLDALAHAIEAFIAPPSADAWQEYPAPVFRGRGPLTDAFALMAVEQIAPALETAVAHPGDLGAREAVAYGSLCAGIAFSHAGTGLAHALQYPVGAATATPHGLGVALLLPYALERVRPAAAERLARLAGPLGAGEGDHRDAERAIDAVARLAGVVGVPSSLAELGLTRAEIPRLAEQASGIERLLRNSPARLGRSDLEEVLDAAWAGDRLALRRASAGAPR